METEKTKCLIVGSGPGGLYGGDLCFARGFYAYPLRRDGPGRTAYDHDAD